MCENSHAERPVYAAGIETRTGTQSLRPSKRRGVQTAPSDQPMLTPAPKTRRTGRRRTQWGDGRRASAQAPRREIGASEEGDGCRRSHHDERGCTTRSTKSSGSSAKACRWIIRSISDEAGGTRLVGLLLLSGRAYVKDRFRLADSS